jgi:hypothetical protein
MGTQNVADMVENLGYPRPPIGYLREVQLAMRRNRPSPYVPDSREARAWVRFQKIQAMEARSPETQEALELLADPNYRPVIELLLISATPIQGISENLLSLSGRSVSTEVIDVYAHYFWNRNLLTQKQWSNFLEDYPGGKDLLQCYLADSTVALWKVGINPQLDDKVILDKVLGDAFMRWLELLVEPNSIDVARKAAVWSSVLFKAIEERREGPATLARALEDMYQMSLRLKSMPVKDARALLDSNATVTDITERIKQ